ncbi:hypothetical protein CARUB_v10003012mg [Capsella rubella]|uniref:F-box domain-containing protein n=1 Tax=Capsella rubella TaxID=81985 RepID=R0FC46_9BRAS|nr:putative F-box only protein 15 [Capsella rubella]EOA19642.1 hypothetical protein CARUB_v10003012mg [Capsella rubella]
MASSKRLMWSLPLELIEEILKRTPAESVYRFKSTCKEWHDLITDKRFMYNHLDHSPERFIRFDDKKTVQIMDPVTGILTYSPIPDVFCYPYSIASMVHCDGLMLCMCNDSSFRQTKHANLAVWNPVTRKIKWIEPLVCFYATDNFGIGYDNTCRDNYKILRFSSPLSLRDPAKCEIYEFKSDSWRTLDGIKLFDWDVDTQCRGVSLKGNMYWIAKREDKEDFIQSFDFSTEMFKYICVCPPWSETQQQDMLFCHPFRRLGCFNGDRLSLLLQHGQVGSMHIEVLVTNKLSDEVVSFTKYFNVTSPYLPALQFQCNMAPPGYFVGKHSDIMAWCEGDVEEDDEWYTCITLYQIDQGGIRKQIETGRHEESRYSNPPICSYVYVPGLIPLLE